jgi:AcrR family transcriptional regulator
MGVVVTSAISSRARSNTKGNETRELILLAAERLFAQRGIAAVALRDIAVAAGQRNNFAVQYHFGDRDGLLRDITAFRSRISDESRTAMITELAVRGRHPEVKDLVAAFVVPLSNHLRPENYYLAFLSRYVIERGGYSDFESAEATTTVLALGHHLRRLLPDYPPSLFRQRWMMATTTAVHAMARYQTLMNLSGLPATMEELVDDLVTVVTAVLQAGYPGTAHPRDPSPAASLQRPQELRLALES